MLSGAQIKINQVNDDEKAEIKASEETPVIDRKIIITGTPESISLAQYLINLRCVWYLYIFFLVVVL